MMTFILLACLAADPTVCKDYKIPLDGEMDEAHCVMYAPPFFARWIDEHPGWTIRRWTCKAAAEDPTLPPL